MPIPTQADANSCALSCGAIIGICVVGGIIISLFTTGCPGGEGGSSSAGSQSIPMPSDPCSTDLFIYNYGLGVWVVNHPRYEDPTPVSSLPIPPIIVEHAEQLAKYTTDGIVPLKAAYRSAGFCD